MRRHLEKELISWKKRKEHLPLLLRGARQVGKSYLVEHFGKEHFQDIAVIDFERRPEFKRCFSTREPREILAQLEVVLQQPVIAGKTLLFLDEIQECPEALVSLRYFRELMPELHVIAAGSLMEFLLNDEKYSFPVGRVEFLYLRPLSFLEYLESAAPLVAGHLKNIDLFHPPSPTLHEELLKWVRRYLFIGGMPFAVKETLGKESFLECQRVHGRILQAYESDFGKYAKYAQHKNLQLIFQRAPALIGQILKYARIDGETRSRDLKIALDLLGRAGLLQQVFATTASGMPLHAHMRLERFKLLFLDVGMLQTALKTDAEALWHADLLQINAGALAEQFVGQELLAYSDPYQNKPLLFWERGEGKEAEVDYVSAVDSQIVPIEVKAGATGRLRSLHIFLELKKASFGVRFSEQPLSLHQKVLSIPLYLISQFPELVKQALFAKDSVTP